MWSNGKIDGYEYSVKHFENGSEFGIDEGRISKIEIRKDGNILANYDRGWDIEPKDATVKAILIKLLERYN
jgi:flagellar hook protein FlgE